MCEIISFGFYGYNCGDGAINGFDNRNNSKNQGQIYSFVNASTRVAVGCVFGELCRPFERSTSDAVLLYTKIHHSQVEIYAAQRGELPVHRISIVISVFIKRTRFCARIQTWIYAH